MSSTFLGLNTAYTGLQAANAALNTTANNIANVETEGYSRQQVQTQAATPIRAFTTYGCVGAGVDTLAIERVRDIFYDEKYWENNSKLGEYEVKDYYMDIIQKYYKDDDSVKGFNTIFDEFYDSLEELAKNPGDITVRQQAIGYANNLCTYFNDMYTNLQKLQTDINHEMKVNVDRINSISQEICALNKQINVIEMNTGTMANELRDQRDLLIDELSKIIDVEVEEIDIIDTNSPLRDTGGTRYVVKICGQTLVDGNSYRTLACVPRANTESVNQTDVTGLYDIYFTGDGNWTSQEYRDQGEALNVYGGTTGGTLAGLVQMRDGNNGEQFAGTVTNVEAATQKVTVEVSADYLTDLNKLNLSQNGGVITIGDTRYYYESWTYNYVEGENGKGTCTFEFKLDVEKNGGNNVTVFAATQELSATIGPDIQYQGIPYYLSQMNEWVRMFATAYNNIMKTGVQDNGDAGLGLFTCEDTEGKEYTFFLPDEDTSSKSYEKTGNAGNIIRVTDHADSYYQLTAGNFKIVDEILNNASKLATRTEQYAGVDDNDVVKSLIDMKTNTKVMSFRGCSADQYLVCMLADVALNAQRAETFKDNYEIMGNTISNQRLSICGVDNDEEAVNLTKFQHAYNMASKMIQVLTEVYDRLILQTGV